MKRSFTSLQRLLSVQWSLEVFPVTDDFPSSFWSLASGWIKKPTKESAWCYSWGICPKVWVLIPWFCTRTEHPVTPVKRRSRFWKKILPSSFGTLISLSTPQISIRSTTAFGAYSKSKWRSMDSSPASVAFRGFFRKSGWQFPSRPLRTASIPGRLESVRWNRPAVVISSRILFFSYTVLNFLFYCLFGDCWIGDSVDKKNWKKKVQEAFPHPVSTKERRWDETTFGMKQWQAARAVALIIENFMTHAARHCFTPNAVSSHLPSFVLFFVPSFSRWNSQFTFDWIRI